MSNPSAKQKSNMWNSIQRYIAIVFAILAISFVFPNYLFDKVEIGDTWRNPDLVAKKDITIELDNHKLEQKVASIQNEIGKVYTKQNIDLSDLSVQIGSQLNLEMTDYTELTSILLDCYQKGLISQSFEGNIQLFEKGISTQKRNEDICKKADLLANIAQYYNSIGYRINSEERKNIRALLTPNLIIDDALTAEMINAKSKSIESKSQIIKGQTIIETGQIITEDKYSIIKKNAHLLSMENTGINIVSASGFLLLITMILLALLLYVRKYFSHIYHSTRKLSFLLIWPVIFSYLVYGIENYTSLSTYVIPFCIVPIVVKNFFGDRLALITHIVVVLIASILSKLGYEFTFLQILAGIVTVLVVSETRYWDKFFIALGFIFLSYMLGYLGLDLAQWTSTGGVIEWKTFGWLALNALLLLMAYPFIPLLENIFGFTSSIKLAELSDLNKPLLKELSIKAPGTLQHSLQVANLCEAAAEKIGANSLLVKTAALYHDIGKMSKPEYFIENNKGENKHAALNNNFESAKIIIGHVTDGVAMATKNRIPNVLIDFIKSHHGTTRVEYFYRNQKNDNPDKEFDESLFRYPGPLPVSKEETILMIADSLEAASKSLKSPTGQDIDILVDKIIAFKIDHGQLETSNLSFSELEECTSVFKAMLRNINHVRIEYPEDKSKSA